MLGEDLKSLWTPAEELSPDEKLRAQLIDQYKIYVEMADRIASRRLTTNSFFLTINTAMLGILGFIERPIPGGTGEPTDFSWAIALAGAFLNVLWFQIVNSYKKIAGIKWKMVAALERRLPSRPYEVEWIVAGRGEDAARYRPFTHIEQYIPWLFVVLHVLVLWRVIPWAWTWKSIWAFFSS